jgi:hypothetical protein
MDNAEGFMYIMTLFSATRTGSLEKANRLPIFEAFSITITPQIHKKTKYA